jgi:hypothetical protein
VVGLFASLCLLLYNLWQVLLKAGFACGLPLLMEFVQFTAASDAPSTTMLTVAIPGVTLPFDQLLYLWIGKRAPVDKRRSKARFAAGISASVGFHEFGHALSAASLHVRSQSVGFFWVLFFPGAYVEIEQEGFNALRPWQRLRISAAGALFVCRRCRESCAVISSLVAVVAGIWHNIVLALVSVRCSRFVLITHMHRLVLARWPCFHTCSLRRTLTLRWPAVPLLLLRS